jgi:hypothetical protein
MLSLSLVVDRVFLAGERLEGVRTLLLLLLAPVLILDERTANLDPANEHELLAALYEPAPDLSNPATCCVVYRAYRAAKWRLAPVLTPSHSRRCIRVSEKTSSRQ